MQTTQKPVIGVILGSNRTARLGGAVTGWVMTNLTREDYTLKLIDLAAIDLPFLDEPDIPAHGHYQHASTRKFAELIAACDGFVLVFPQYNWGYPAVLKNALDTLYAEWQNKPVGTIIYGNHAIQADIAIRLVLAGLQMRQLATNVGLRLQPTTTTASVSQDFRSYGPLVAAMGNEFALRLTAHHH